MQEANEHEEINQNFAFFEKTLRLCGKKTNKNRKPMNKH
jgi:hypothetical protein